MTSTSGAAGMQADAAHMPTRFQSKYEAAAARNRSLLCVGLDPDPERTPAGVDPLDFLTAIVEATAGLVCCYKPNIAFYEPDLGAGFERLAALIERIPDGVPVLLDAKRGDVPNTAAAYARAVYGSLDADAATVNPYLGLDSVEPFLAYADRTSFILVRTSNPGARDLQDLEVVGGEDDRRPLYEHVAALAGRWNETRGNVGMVVGATYPDEAARIRAICPALPVLLPGIGAQAGDLEASVRAAVDASGGGVLVNASRSVLYAGEARGAGPLREWAAAAHDEALRLRDAIEAAREARPGGV